MILFFTDFGYEGPYVGQMRAAATAIAPATAVVDLMHDAPRFNPRAAAYLLAAAARDLPDSCVVCGVVDPGVGSDRRPVVVEAGGRRFVGPDNGVFEIVARRCGDAVSWRVIEEIPDGISKSFHGRDLFAPTAARLAVGDPPQLGPLDGDRPGMDWPDDLAEIVYVDGFGNAMTGFRASHAGRSGVLHAAGTDIPAAATFSDVPVGSPFWYRNSLGLVEIAVNQGSAAGTLGLSIGSRVSGLVSKARL